MDLGKMCVFLVVLVASLQKADDLGERQELLLSLPEVEKSVREGHFDTILPHLDTVHKKVALFSLIAIGQAERILDCEEPLSRASIDALFDQLVALDQFYESIGGLVGYHHKIVERLRSPSAPDRAQHFSLPYGVDLSQEAAIQGLRALPDLGEIYPIGGLGSRLNFLSQEGEPLPVACLPFAGRTLLEGLIRDVQGREFLYARLFGTQVTVPIALMTSFNKKNMHRVRAICEKNGWFGRDSESFFIFSQLSVPVLNREGNWVLEESLHLYTQPGGHGALWRTAEEAGVFTWFEKLKKHRLLVRQINNPVGGTDMGLLALLGAGAAGHKTFGFASCPRLPHAAEGALVLKEGHLSNIEYTEFKKYGIESAAYPANTNILYVDLKKVRSLLKKNPLPGLMLNMKQEEGGRLESMMQNISDEIPAKEAFLTFGSRSKTLSAAKRSFQGGELLETPEGAFYDHLFNAHQLFESMCEGSFSTQEEYVARGPSHLILYHPALGPLYSVIQQKIRDGKLARGSEMQLEIADLDMEDVEVEGSLLIEAEQVMGHVSQGLIRYGHETGKCVLKRVKVKNRGIDRAKKNVFWENRIHRHEALTIILEGRSEFYAEGVTFSGNEKIVVPDGERWIARQRSDGRIVFDKERADGEWGYRLEGQNLLHQTHLVEFGEVK